MNLTTPKEDVEMWTRPGETDLDDDSVTALVLGTLCGHCMKDGNREGALRLLHAHNHLVKRNHPDEDRRD